MVGLSSVDFSKYLEYQIVGSKFLASKKRSACHDEMGLGKTLQAIGAMDLTQSRKAMIVCPAVVILHWIREIRRFSIYDRKISAGRKIHDLKAWKIGRFDVLVTSYELATRWQPGLYEEFVPFDMLILDEAHYLKSRESARTKALLGDKDKNIKGMVELAHRTIQLTGTPVPNDPADIYTFLRFVKAMPLTELQFRKRYFNGAKTSYSNRHTVKEDKVQELNALISNNSIRRTKDQVGIHLPDIFLTETVLDGDTSAVLELLRDHPGLEEATQYAIELGGLSFLDTQHIGTLRRLIGEAKAVPYSRLLKDEVLSGVADKRVVFGLHRQALADIQEYLLEHNIFAVKVTGDVTTSRRQQAIDSFQNDPECKVLLGNIRAAGTGITLTASCEVDMLESDWTPAGNVQAIMRVHRIGQTRKVRARFITLADSIDEYVNKVVRDKTHAISALQEGAMYAVPS